MSERRGNGGKRKKAKEGKHRHVGQNGKEQKKAKANMGAGRKGGKKGPGNDRTVRKQEGKR